MEILTRLACRPHSILFAGRSIGINVETQEKEEILMVLQCMLDRNTKTFPDFSVEEPHESTTALAPDLFFLPDKSV